MTSPDITRHGRKRMRQRLGIPKGALSRTAEAALIQGVGHEDSTGKLRSYIEFLYASHNGAAGNIRVYNGYVYVFNGRILITILRVPRELAATAQAQQKRKREKEKARAKDAIHCERGGAGNNNQDGPGREDGSDLHQRPEDDGENGPAR